jgi:uncharacterized surface protein with fasciclin (FAS1) repeats
LLHKFFRGVKPSVFIARKWIKQNLRAMKKPIHFFALLIAMFILTTAAHPQKTVEVGGAAMYPTKNIVENAVNSKDHTTLVAAVKAAGLVETLKSDGPFTVFAPTNKAFEKLPEGTVDNLLKPENKATLTAVLTYHMIAGRIDAATLMQWIKKNKGTYTAKTVQGGELKFMLDKENNIWLMDGQGNKAMVTIKDVFQKNGVIHVIDTVIMPEM